MARITILSMIWLLAGCFAPAPEPSALQPAPPPAGGRKVPFVMEVADELNDGKRLHLRLHLMSEGVWDADKLAVRAVGLNAGEVLREEQHVLSKLLEREGVALDPPGRLPEEVSFAFSLPSEGLTDYQVELLWGEEALAAAPPAEAPPPHASGCLELRALNWREEQDCAQPPCRVLVRLKGEMVNAGRRSVSTAVLAVRFMRAAGGGIRTLVDEQEVRVEGLDLNPGESRPLELEIDRGGLGQAVSGLEPVIRIVREE